MHRSRFDPGWKGGVDIPSGWDHDAPLCKSCGIELDPNEQDWGKWFCFDCKQQCSLCFEHRETNETARNGAFICNECLAVESAERLKEIA